MKEHTIMMVSKEGNTEVTYKNVIGFEMQYGCLLVLKFEDGCTATFENENWLMFDLTPMKGWNSNI
ncbi:MAG TPA: hypothetical protein VHO66_08155 [Ruminiclostridium sp.]|nr:hypothetical protein [Ruminiclostridium sp.]